MSGFFCVKTFETELPGYAGIVRFREGEWVDSSHTVLRDFGENFEPEAAARARIGERAKDPRNVEGPEQTYARSYPARDREPGERTFVDQFRTAAFDGARRALERSVDEYGMADGAATAMERLAADRRDPSAWTARYLEAAGSEEYERAFAKYLEHGEAGAPLHWTREEQLAWQKVYAVEKERATMQTGSGAAGGFALPIVIDPSVMLTSAGAINPIRALARVFTTNTTEWRGVSSAGVTVTYAPELAVVAEGSPALAQPTILTEKWHGFSEFSIELHQDWGSLSQELIRLFTDARDVNDATIFLTGTGTDQPAGVLTGLSTSQRIQCAAAGFPAIADHYSLKQAVPPRFMANLTFAANPAQYDRTYQLVSPGSTTGGGPLLPTREGDLLGRPKVEWSTMSNVVTAGQKLMLAGDFRAAYFIVDRIGVTAELIQHTFDQATARPKGARGLYIYGRCGAKVVVPEGLRYLETI